MNQHRRHKWKLPSRRRTLTVVSIVLTVLLIWVSETSYFRIATASDIRLLLFTLQAGLTFAVALWGGSRVPWQERIRLSGIGLLAMAVMVIVTFRWHRRLIFLSLAVLLRAYYVTAIFLAAAFVTVLAVSIIRRSVRWHRWAPTMLRIGFGATFVFGSLEAAAAWLQPSWKPDFQLPDLPESPESNQRTIVAIGGSTMVGLPYAPDFGILPAAEWYLNKAYPNLKIETQNLAVTGINQRQAIATLTDLETKPDVLVIYSGHNEFFHESDEMATIRMTSFGSIDDWLILFPTFRIVNPLLSQYLMAQSSWVTERNMIDTPICPPSVGEVRRQRFQAELRQLFKWARRQDIYVVYCPVVSDTATFAPNFSGCRDCLPADRVKLEQEWQKLKHLQADGEHEQVLESCRNVLSRFPDVADFYYLAGTSLRSLRRYSEADLHFQQAKDLDGFPIRALQSYMNAAIDVATEFDIPIIDSETRLRSLSSDGLLSNELFLDGVHPNLKSYHVLGHAIAESIVQHDLLRSPTPAMELKTDLATCLERFQFTTDQLAEAYERTAVVLDHYADFRPFDATPRRNRAALFRNIAADLRTNRNPRAAESVESLIPPIADSPKQIDQQP
ncbi:MAG: hypothetical protein Fues2KO_42070 [Fuerstiella sp.]